MAIKILQNVELCVDILQYQEYYNLSPTKHRKEERMSLTVKQWRMAKGISQEAMAAVCRVHRNTYAAWEENPGDITVKNAVLICNALGESLEDVFFNDATLQNVDKGRETA